MADIFYYKVILNLENNWANSADCRRVHCVCVRANCTIKLTGGVTKQELSYVDHNMRIKYAIETEIMMAIIEGTKKRGCLRARWTNGVKDITRKALPEVAGDWLDGVETECQEGHHTSAETYQKRYRKRVNANIIIIICFCFPLSVLLYFTLLYFTLLYFTLLYFTLL